VLDPFAGSGTTLQVAVDRGRNAIGIELKPEYAALARKRLAGVTAPLFAEGSAA
jgi:DNA modification methylase